MGTDRSFPALEELKRQTEGLDLFIEAAPPLVAKAVSWLIEVEYLDRKEEILDERDEHRRRFVEGRQRIEATYGSVVMQALRKRSDGEQPRFDLERSERELTDARKAIDDLDDDLDTAYLTRRELRELSALRSDLYDAHEYVRNKRAFDHHRETIEPEIEAFEDRYRPYGNRDRYMITSDRDWLFEKCDQIWVSCADKARELSLHVLPDEDTVWLGEQKSRFSTLLDVIPEYNRSFVAEEREQFADLFETEHGPLNSQQQNAIVRDDRRNLVDASAGTGKTLTLTYRYLYLLEKGVAPDDIVAITYTTDAADEMKDRISDLVGVDPDSLNIATIHAFALRLYSETTESRRGKDGPELGELQDELVETFFEGAMEGLSAENVETALPGVYTTFKTHLQQFFAIDVEKGHVQEHKRYNESSEEFLRRRFGSFLSNARTFDLSASEIRDQLETSDPLVNQFGAAGAALVEAYEYHLARDEHPTDFEDMLDSATEEIRSHPEEFGSRYEHILVDEFQDMTQRSLQFIESFMLGGKETHLFCVGDDWQSIFGFAGSNVRFFTEYEDRFDDVTYTGLKTNYRCPPSVVDAGAELMARSEVRQNTKEVEAHSTEETKPQIHAISGLYDARATEYVADLVEDALGEGYDYDDVMVLARNDEKSDYHYRLRQELEERNVPHRRAKKKNDYLPQAYKETFESEIEFIDGDAVFADGEEKGERVPMVLVQSVHRSKGTEAPVVILQHAVDNHSDGIPIEERTEKLLAPSVDITAEHIPEERRLFYVALTRTEEELHIVGDDGLMSRYLEDIDGFCERNIVGAEGVELIGECTNLKVPGEGDSWPINAWLNCGDFGIPLVAWPGDNTPALREGETYRITNPVVERRDSKEELWFAKSNIERVSAEKVDP